MTGFVYFLRCGEFVKVGYSRQPKKRLATLQTATPHDVELLGRLPGTMAQERAVHRCLQHLHHRNEWFRMSDDIIALIREGLPSVDTAPAPQSFASVIDAVGYAVLTEGLSLSMGTVSSWRARDSIPSWYLARVAEIAAAHGVEGASVEQLVYIKAGKPASRRVTA